jgi:hypothetical protein
MVARPLHSGRFELKHARCGLIAPLITALYLRVSAIEQGASQMIERHCGRPIPSKGMKRCA